MSNYSDYKKEERDPKNMQQKEDTDVMTIYNSDGSETKVKHPFLALQMQDLMDREEARKMLDIPPVHEPEIIDDFIQTKYGYCHFEIEAGKNPIIFNLYVHPQYRRLGHGKKILQYVINEIRQTGYEGVIDIEAAPRENSIDREKLAAFYAMNGLKVV